MPNPVSGSRKSARTTDWPGGNGARDVEPAAARRWHTPRRMSWYKVRDGRVVFAGGLTKEPFTAWTATREGTAAIDAGARGIGFRLLGRKRAARARIWRELPDAASAQEGRDALQAAADLYLRTISTLAYAAGLPR